MGEPNLRSTPPPIPAPFALRVFEGPDKDQLYPIAKKSIIVGRGTECDLQLHDMKCSRSHVKLELLGRTMKATNVSGFNPLYVNGQEVAEALLNVGAVISIGTSCLRFELHSADASTGAPLPPPARMPEARPGETPPQSHGNGISSSLAAADLPFTNPKQAAGRSPLFYICVVGFLGFTVYVATLQSRNARKLNPIRTAEIVDKELESLQAERDKLVQRRIREGKDTEAFEQAQSAFIKGFRDYREGNYKRAITNLDAARALYPDHPQATRYRLLASQRLDQLVQDTMREARGQVERNQYRVAVSNYRKVIVLLDDANNPTFREARLQIERLQEVLKGDL